VGEVLAHIEAGALLPPLVVLQALAANPALKLSAVKAYAARALAAEAAAVDEDRKVIGRFQEETAAMRAEIDELKTKVGQCIVCPIFLPDFLPTCSMGTGPACGSPDASRSSRLELTWKVKLLLAL